MNAADVLDALHWREPLWLLLALQPLALWAVLAWRGRARLAAYADRAVRPWAAQRPRRGFGARLCSRATAYALAWVLAALAAAGPRVALEVPAQARGSGDTVLAVVDLSGSMAATDVAPSRLRRARLELHELLARSAGARVGVIVYAARPHLLVPPTDDLEALRFYIDTLDRLRLPTRGSNAAAALRMAGAELAAAEGARHVVWVTDGDLGEDDAARRGALDDAVAALRGDSVALSILGTGTVEGAALRADDGTWLADNGRAVVSRMDEAALRGLARAGGGAYMAARADDSDWRTLYTPRTRLAFSDASLVVWRELYAWFLWPAVLLLFVALRPRRAAPVAAALVAWLVCAPAGLLPGRAHADEATAAWRAHERADHAAAAALYARIGGYTGRLGEGVSRYRLGAWEEAARQFAEAVLAADTDAQRAAALHNLGNALFRLGDYATAVDVFTDALHYRPDHAATAHNLEFSAQLQAEVERRTREAAAAERAGSGPRTARATPGMAIGDRTGVTLDESARAAPRVPEPERYEQLVRAGIERLRLAAAGNAAPTARAWRQDLQRARQLVREIDDDRARLWTRIFEIEEGFDASPALPLVLPGVRPW